MESELRRVALAEESDRSRLHANLCCVSLDPRHPIDRGKSEQRRRRSSGENVEEQGSPEDEGHVSLCWRSMRSSAAAKRSERNWATALHECRRLSMNGGSSSHSALSFLSSAFFSVFFFCLVIVCFRGSAFPCSASFAFFLSYFRSITLFPLVPRRYEKEKKRKKEMLVSEARISSRVPFSTSPCHLFF